jgi:hypothetical protein
LSFYSWAAAAGTAVDAGIKASPEKVAKAPALRPGRVGLYRIADQGAAASRIGNGDPLAAGVLAAGLVLILGALVYRSAKRRRLGEVASTPARWVLEGIAIVLMFLIVLLP